MGRGVDWPGSNGVRTAPAGHEGHVSTVPVFANSQTCVTCWELSEEELAEVVRTRRVFASVFMFGGNMPPLYVGDEASTREVVADYGTVWRK